ncbi:MAG: extradiol dioxygenase, partial [Nitriliruptorales bacterium]|nr:extradiol dioxygenase [Nitriliruptorales bacterium]
MPLGHLGVNVSDLARAKEYFDEFMPLVSYVPF